METVNLYRAIDEARRISEAGGTFSIKFRKWNRATRDGGDLAVIGKARCRPKASDERVSHASHKLFITDTETGRPLVCWHPLIMEIDGRRTAL